ncbi:hypothetical protein DFQ28_008607 [Apophysomyces sp. BC1034]|nr:hypothetical protein DFQ30_006907 [Apophysomyces sp. BC1015]KAG0173046.1 hypothetical protein DFQ29_008120 [Apophysomyces sp. BC1021]KAG0192609.1 hypothetical protein DFQ28_008607 [Apophysomyces sp. BC1034]
MRFSLFALCGSVLLAVTVRAAPVEQHHNVAVKAATENPVIQVLNPLAAGVGSGVTGAAAPTQQVADLADDAVATLFDLLGGLAANAEQGIGVATANVAPAVQGTVQSLQENSGIIGTALTLIGGQR